MGEENGGEKRGRCMYGRFLHKYGEKEGKRVNDRIEEKEWREYFRGCSGV